MQIVCGDLNLTSVASGLLATAVGVYLGFLANSVRERISRIARRRKLMFAATQEVLLIIADFETMMNTIASGELERELGVRPSEAARLNAPSRPILFPKLIEELEAEGKGKSGPMLSLLRTWSNTERLCRAIQQTDIPKQEALVSSIQAILVEYARLTWKIRGIYLKDSEEFRIDRWRNIVNLVNKEDDLEQFFEADPNN